MRLEISENNGKPYIRVVESITVLNPNTNRKVPRKRIIKSIGPVSKFDDGKPNFIERLKASYDAGMPIIEELKDYCRKNTKKEVYDIRLFEGMDECFAEPKLIANNLLEAILRELDVDQLIRTYKTKYEVNFDVYGFIKSLIFGRILNPASKISTIRQNGEYYEPLVKGSYSEFDVYKTLDFVNEHRRAFFNRINTSMTKSFGRTTNYVYYDVTNFFFETDEEDSNIEMSDGMIVPGLRKSGVSKENKRNPIVQMGLLMDEQGIPVSVEVFPGNMLDHQTLKKSFENTVDSIKSSRYIYVCDKGIGRGDNLGYAVVHGNGYLTSKSVRGATKVEKDWMLDQNGYIHISEDFKYKTKIIKKKYTDSNGVVTEYSEKVLTYWSKKFFEKERAEKADFYEMIQKIIESPDSFRTTKMQSKLLKKYTSKKYIHSKTGELVDPQDLIASLDMGKIKREYDLLGYYTIITSETNMDDRQMIDTYKNLVEIEDQFRVMKSTLDTRPIFVRTPEHIAAHLTLCAISLIIIRMIQRQIKLKNPKPASNVYDVGMSADRIQKALNKWKVESVGDVYYRFCGMNDPDLMTILNAFDISIPKKCYRFSDLKTLKAAIKCQYST